MEAKAPIFNSARTFFTIISLSQPTFPGWRRPPQHPARIPNLVHEFSHTGCPRPAEVPRLEAEPGRRSTTVPLIHLLRLVLPSAPAVPWSASFRRRYWRSSQSVDPVQDLGEQR